SFVIVNWHKRPREETPILGEPRGPKTELRMSPEETIKSVEEGGLKLKKIVEVPPYHYGVVFTRGADMSAIGPKHVCFWGQSGHDHFALRNVRFFFPMALGPLLCMAGYVRLFHQFISTSVKQFAV